MVFSITHYQTIVTGTCNTSTTFYYQMYQSNYCQAIFISMRCLLVIVYVNRQQYFLLTSRAG